ncbi:erythromycin esterase family protein, partial [Gemmatimonadota bacterium]
RYVLTGEGDPGEGLDGIYFWTWNTREVLAMIEWMRDFNASGVGRIEFRGFDMQNPSVAMTEVIAFLAEADPEYREEAEEHYTAVSALYMSRRRSRQYTLSREDTERYIALTQEVLEQLIRNREEYCRRFPVEEVDRVIQDARVVRQSAEPAYRDRSMAENVDWILTHHPPETRIVLWAHNGHIHERYPSMGWYLADRYHEDYYAIGFSFADGEYTAVGSNGLSSYPADPPVAGSVEYLLEQTGLPRFILDLQVAEAGSPASGWLHTPRPFRSIGAAAIENPFYPAALAKDYDALIWIAHTTPSVLRHPR